MKRNPFDTKRPHDVEWFVEVYEQIKEYLQSLDAKKLRSLDKASIDEALSNIDDMLAQLIELEEAIKDSDRPSVYADEIRKKSEKLKDLLDSLEEEMQNKFDHYDIDIEHAKTGEERDEYVIAKADVEEDLHDLKPLKRELDSLFAQADALDRKEREAEASRLWGEEAEEALFNPSDPFNIRWYDKTLRELIPHFQSCRSRKIGQLSELDQLIRDSEHFRKHLKKPILSEDAGEGYVHVKRFIEDVIRELRRQQEALKNRQRLISRAIEATTKLSFQIESWRAEENPEIYDIDDLWRRAMKFSDEEGVDAYCGEEHREDLTRKYGEGQCIQEDVGFPCLLFYDKRNDPVALWVPG
jgi:hypothetical protein